MDAASHASVDRLAHHGGRLGLARALHPGAPRPWVDLSTGINPRPYPAPRSTAAERVRLPDITQLAELERTAAETFGVDDSACVVAVGGSELALRLLPIALKSSAATIVGPTYSSHADAWRSARVRVTEVEATDVESSYERGGVVVVVNPNNPDGRLLGPQTLLDLHDTLATTGGALVVDEAFMDVMPEHSLADRAGGARAPQLVVLRSFGKFYGLAGVRLGFVIASPVIAQRLRGLIGDWPICADALAAGLAAYKDSVWRSRDSRATASGRAKSRRLAHAARFRNRRRHVAVSPCATCGRSVAFRGAVASRYPRAPLCTRRHVAAIRSAIRQRGLAATDSSIEVNGMSDATDETSRDLAHRRAMQQLQVQRHAERATKRLSGGLLLVLTGDGKGKSSSGFGMVARALGWEMRVGIVQFIKGKWQTGERNFFRRFPDLVTYEVMGEGFTWDVQDRQRDLAAAARGWARASEMIADPAYDFVLLDELNIALRNEYLDIDAVVRELQTRPRDKHVCITGRDAKPQLLAIADLVTEMAVVKHPYANGYRAQKGIEF